MYRIGIHTHAEEFAYLEEIPKFTEDSDYLINISFCDGSRCYMFESEDEAFDIARKLGFIFSNCVFIDRQTEWERIMNY